MKSVPVIAAAAALLISGAAMSQALTLEAQYGAASDVLTKSPNLAPVVIINACPVPAIALPGGPRSFETVSRGAVLKALSSGGSCWTRLGMNGDKGYSVGDVRAVATSQNSNDDGVSTAYDVYVGKAKVGTAMRAIATKPFFYGFGEVVAADAEGSTVRFGDGSEVLVKHQARPVGARTPVYAMFSNGTRSFGFRKS